MTTIFKNNHWLWILLALFMVTRFFGVGQLYHQDEYRWVSIVNSEAFGKLDSPHPPMIEFMLSLAGKLWGYGNLRVVPLIVSIFNLLLVYLISLRLSGSRKIAYFASGLFVVNVYSLIASLMIDIDGAVLPFFVLLSYFAYLKFSLDGDKRFIPIFILAIAGGFLTKLSFFLFIAALGAEYLLTIYQKRKFWLEFKKILVPLGIAALTLCLVYVFFVSKDSFLIKYATHFKIFNFGSRAYSELVFKLVKSLIWLSPLLILPFGLGLFKKDIFKRYRFWFIYILFNLLFYLVVFDFARLTIERYLMFSIIPLIIISSDVMVSYLSKLNRRDLVLATISFFILSIVIISLNQEIVPLNPKSAYVDKIKDLNFNFLIPLTGGSGPIGFYVSAQFILWMWMICFVGFFVKRKWGMALFLVFGLGYNIFLSSEFLFGTLYGSVNNITKNSVDYVIDNPEIEGVITYYDAGVYYLRLAGKYDARFYTAPSRDYSERIKEYRGHYMIVDFPAVNKDHEYWKLISRCDLDKKFTDKYVDSYIYDCRSLPADTK